MTASTTAPAPALVRVWNAVCRYSDLEPERGVAALVDGQQVAVFRLHDGSVCAIDHRDPFSGAYVLARGIVGSRGDVPFVASPMYKQAIDLRTGECLDDAGVRVRVFAVRIRDGRVEVATEPADCSG
jgi:nitrite reductase (NADH) small subunit